MKKKVVGGFTLNTFASVTEAGHYIFSNFVGKQSSAVAINPEKIISAMDSESLRKAINTNEIKYTDGIGVSKYLSFKYKTHVARVPGCELWEEMMKIAGQAQTPVFIVGATTEVLMKTKERLASLYGVNIIGVSNGFFEDELELISQIKKSKAEFVSVAMGSPKQETFISTCRQEGVEAFLMGVGGTYDVFTGNVVRAPKLFQKLGLEWLYRALRQPVRFTRQGKLFRFLWLALRNKL